MKTKQSYFDGSIFFIWSMAFICYKLVQTNLSVTESIFVVILAALCAAHALEKYLQRKALSLENCPDPIKEQKDKIAELIHEGMLHGLNEEDLNEMAAKNYQGKNIQSLDIDQAELLICKIVNK